MKYIIRLNRGALNPLTREINAKKLWEVEQCEKSGGNGRQDSEKVIWHCADVRIDGKHIREQFVLPAPGAPPWEFTCWGVCSRGSDDAIEIKTSTPEASGN